MVTFVFSSPTHHVEMMIPIAEALRRRGIASTFVSLAELRGRDTPERSSFPVPVRRAMPKLRRSPTHGTTVTGTSGSRLRRTVRQVVWRAALGPRIQWLLRDATVVVVPNDAAYPFKELVGNLRVPFALLQEGIRFPLPNERAAVDDPYGLGGAAALFAWGEASAEHFRSIGVAPSTIHVTGNPRFDTVDPAAWAGRGAGVRARFGLTKPPLLVLSSAIDDIGLCTPAEKYALFGRFLRAAAPVLARDQRGVLVKLHPREDVAAFRAAAVETGVPNVHVVDDEPLFSVLAAGAAAVITASTVGLEALAFGLPLGVLPIPGHGHVFDYVSAGAALGLAEDGFAAGVEALLASRVDDTARGFLERHMAHRGHAAERAADRLSRFARS